MKERISALLKRTPSAEIVTAEGWVRTKRDSKNVCFLEVNDGSCLKGLQIVIDKDKLADQSILAGITTGCSVICRGPIVESAGGDQAVEMACSDITLVGECPVDTYPLQKKRHTIEYLREISHLRARTNMFGAVARVRNHAQLCRPSVFPGTRVRLCKHPDHQRQRRRRRRRTIFGDHLGPEQRSEDGGWGGRLLQGFLRS